MTDEGQCPAGAPLWRGQLQAPIHIQAHAREASSRREVRPMRRAHEYAASLTLPMQ